MGPKHGTVERKHVGRPGKVWREKWKNWARKREQEEREEIRRRLESKARLMSAREGMQGKAKTKLFKKRL